MNSKIQVDGMANQFSGIDQSYMSVDFPYPEAQVAGNYTCLVTGLSNLGTLVRYTQDAELTIGGQ